MMRNILVGVTALFGALQLFGASAADLKRPRPGETVEVLVQYVHQPSHADHRRVTDLRGRVKTTFENVPVAHYDVTPEALADLEGNPDVVSVQPNRKVTGNLDHVMAVTNVDQLSDYYVKQGRAKALGIGIAIIDSGINIWHPDLAAFNTTNLRVVYSASFVPTDTYTGDDYGHGTHVAGIAAGIDNIAYKEGYSGGNAVDPRWFNGVAQDASLISLKVLDSHGNGQDSYVIAAIDAAISLKSKYNIRVINLSLGRPLTTSYKNDPLCQAVEAAWKAGIVVVVAAGNDGRDNSQGTKGYGSIYAPGNDPYVITVGATNNKNTATLSNCVIATYSSKGPTGIDHIVKPDLVAPGNRVVSYQAIGATLSTNNPGNQIPISAYDPGGSSADSNLFLTLSGTSMAAPVVSGIAAMLIDQNTNITPDQVKAKLMRSAWKGFAATMSTTVTNSNGSTTTFTAYDDIFTAGAGQVDAWAAYNSPAPPSGNAASPTAIALSNGKVQLNLNTIAGTTALWGSTAL